MFMGAPSSPQPPFPPAPGRAANPFRGVIAFADVRTRWPFALRAGVCMAIPALIGWLAGDVQAGLMATIGAFTSLYGSRRPYLNRAVQLAVIAVAFGVSVGVGIWASATAWAGVLVVSAIAVLAVWVCNALAVGPPAAYMFVLGCAAGTGMGSAHLNPWHSGLLVFGGGAIAWLLHMFGALFWPRGPEKSAVSSAADAVTDYIDAVGTAGQDAARHWAAQVLYESWATLVSYQPVTPYPDGTLSRLRALNRELHLLFADAMSAAVRREPVPSTLSDQARALSRLTRDPSRLHAHAADDVLPLGRPSAHQLLRRAVTPGSKNLPIMARVGIASLVAGSLASMLGVDHSYWAMAAAVLMLHQGFDWIRTVQRSLERTLGTWVGLILAGLILAAHPQGLWLVLTIGLLQFVIEMLVVRNYALAVIFITPAALTISAAGRQVPDLVGLLLARGIDTAIGCAVALVVYALTARPARELQVPEAIARTLDDIRVTSGHLARGEVTTVEARGDRRDLQVRTIELLQSYDATVGSSVRRRNTAEPMWPAVVATQRLAYRTLSACWATERVGAGEAAREVARTLFGTNDTEHLNAALIDIAEAIRAGSAPAPLDQMPLLVAEEVQTLHESLVQDHSRSHD